MNLLPVLAICLLSFGACNSSASNNNTGNTPETTSHAAPIIGYSIVKTHLHDPSFFTEGFEFYKGNLLESSGGDNDNSPYPSAMGILNLQKGKIDIKFELDKSKYFGEGITVFNNKLYMLTWKGGTGFVYDAETFKPITTFRIPSTEGWGLTHDTASLIMSDGTNNIYFLNPESFQVKYTISVNDNGEPLGNINELEFVNGVIYANRWQTPYILKIDAKSGSVLGKIDLSSIDNEIAAKASDAHEMNGIAYNQQNGNLFITGKKWPTVYELKLQ